MVTLRGECGAKLAHCRLADCNSPFVQVTHNGEGADWFGSVYDLVMKWDEPG